MKPYKAAYSRFLNAQPGRLHFAAHSHHYWPDCTREAMLESWDHAAALADDKWGPLFEGVLTEAKKNIATLLGLSDSRSIALAPNTHEFVARIFSCLDLTKPVRILTTDSEFHSFARQARRYEELPLVSVERISVEPIQSFEERFTRAAQTGSYDLVFVSHVFFNSGLSFGNLKTLAEKTDPQSLLIVDGYHAFAALPVNLSEIEDRVFYLAGGYKYAQAGEGACFLHVPKGCELRPLNTGWFADFESLGHRKSPSTVSYSASADRFAGSTFDPAGWYRFNSVMKWWKEAGITPETIHGHVRNLQQAFLHQLSQHSLRHIRIENLILGSKDVHALEQHGHFLTFRTEKAAELTQALKQEQVIVDYRGDRLRFGFGLYHESADIDALFDRLKRAEARLGSS